MDLTTQGLIKRNRYAPVDRLVRKLIQLGAIYFAVDYGDGRELVDSGKILETWYDVDEMQLSFLLPGRSERSWVYCIHQETFTKPTVEDISDYTVDLDEIPELQKILKGEDVVDYVSDTVSQALENMREVRSLLGTVAVSTDSKKRKDSLIASDRLVEETIKLLSE